jgi:hypothetical protein
VSVVLCSITKWLPLERLARLPKLLFAWASSPGLGAPGPEVEEPSSSVLVGITGDGLLTLTQPPPVARTQPVSRPPLSPSPASV